jgi:hypothetical protein
MIVNITISFNHGVAKYQQVRRLLERIDCLDGLAGLETPFPGLYGRKFDMADPKLEDLRGTLHRAGLTWNEYVDRTYDDAELREFPLVRLVLRRRLISGGGARFGTEYDVSAACLRCGTGAVQTSPLMVPLGELPQQGLICATHQGDFLVGERLARALRKERVSGLELRQVCSHSGNKRLPWWQMLAAHTMPRMDPRTKGMVHDMRPGWGCPVCERDCYEGMDEMVYARSQVNTSVLPDVVQTWECFGRSLLHDDPKRNLARGFAQPLLLMKIRVFEIFRELKVRHAEFEPVRIVG